MIIEACDPGCAEAQELVAALSSALAAITGDSGAASFSLADARVARSLFVVAKSESGTLLGCGALRPLDGAGGVTWVKSSACMPSLARAVWVRRCWRTLNARRKASGTGNYGSRRAASICGQWGFTAPMAISRLPTTADMWDGPRRFALASGSRETAILGRHNPAICRLAARRHIIDVSYNICKH